MAECLTDKRIAWIDNAKAFAIFFIVLGHQLTRGAVYDYLYTFHVLLFFFLSGLTFSAKKPIKQFLAEKFKGIMLPYYLFSIISIGIYNVYEMLKPSGEKISLVNCIIGMLIGTRTNGLMKWNTPLWFLPCLFSLLVGAYLIRRYLLGNNNTIKSDIAVFFVSLAVVITLNYFDFYPNAPLGIIQAVNAFPVFTLGILTMKLLRRGSLKMNNKAVSLILGAVLIAGGALLGRLNSCPDFSLNRFGKLYIFLPAALCEIAGWCLLASLIKFKPLEYIGQNTKVILLTHKFVILFYSLLPIPRTKDNVILGVGLSVVTIALCLAFGWVVEKIYPPIIGKPARKKALAE